MQLITALKDYIIKTRPNTKDILDASEIEIANIIQLVETKDSDNKFIVVILLKIVEGQAKDIRALKNAVLRNNIM